MFIWSLLLVFYLSKLPISLQLTLDDENKPGRSALENFPLVDGHNDLPHNLYKKLNNKIENFPFEKNLSQDSIFGFNACSSCHTDLPRIKKGKLGAQFWVAYVKCRLPHYTNYVSRTMEQIDVIKRLISKYPDNMELVTTADGILETFKRRKLASLIGLEGGHSIDNKLSLLRQYYELGVRYMTLTHSCNLPWADSSVVDQLNSTLSNLTQFGEKVVLEMNRLGMMVDLSHVSYNVMSKAIDISKAPVIFSHSSAYSVYPHHRNVRDDILLKVKINGGIVMVNFYSEFVGRTNVTIRNVVDHINHIVNITGIDHLGIGSDFDGVISVPKGLEDVSKFPDLFDLLKELNPNRWTIANLEKLAGRNFYRVFKQVEKIKEELSTKQPDENWIPEKDLTAIKSESDNCIV